jgi:RNA polymerase sigma-70 factor, ECF subfamily
VDGMSLADYARQSGVSSNNAAVRIHRARRNLKKRLLETCGTCAEHACVNCTCDH